MVKAKLDYANVTEVEAAVKRLRRWLSIWQAWGVGVTILLAGLLFLVDGWHPHFWREVFIHWLGIDPG